MTIVVDDALDEMVGKWLGEKISGDPKKGIVEKPGRYQLLRELGKGGMGAVYEAEDHRMNVRVAIKVVHFEGTPKKASETASRFQSEMQVQVRLRGTPGVVDVYDYGVEGRIGWMAMELLKGMTLKDWLESLKPETMNHKLWRRMLSIFAVVAYTLSRMHALGIVHRDMKPGNVFLVLDEDGHMIAVKIIDFGITIEVDADGKRVKEALTGNGMMTGTFQYMSPQQMFITGKIDARADQWALAVFIFEALSSGYLPRAESLGAYPDDSLQGEYIKAYGSKDDPPDPTFELIPQLFADDDPAKDEKRASIVEMLRIALNKDPEKRHASCWNMAETLYSAIGELVQRPQKGDPNWTPAEETVLLDRASLTKPMALEGKKAPQPETLAGTSSPKPALPEGGARPTKKAIAVAVSLGLALAALIAVLFFPTKPSVQSRDAAVARLPPVARPIVAPDAGSTLANDANTMQPAVPDASTVTPTSTPDASAPIVPPVIEPVIEPVPPTPVVEADAGAPSVEPDDHHRRHGHERRTPQPETDEQLARRLESQGRRACCHGEGNPTWTSRDGVSHNCGSTMSATDRQNLCGHH